MSIHYGFGSRYFWPVQMRMVKLDFYGKGKAFV